MEGSSKGFPSSGLKNRRVKDILILFIDGLTGMREATAAAFPKTDYQRCIVHRVRNTYQTKDRKIFAAVLKTIYQAPTKKKTLEALERVTFPSDTALLKALYQLRFKATKKWTMPIRNRGQVYGGHFTDTVPCDASE